MYQNYHQKIKCLLSPCNNAYIFPLSSELYFFHLQFIAFFFYQLTYQIIPLEKLFSQICYHTPPIKLMFYKTTHQIMSLSDYIIPIAGIFTRITHILLLEQFYELNQILYLTHIFQLTFKTLTYEYPCQKPLSYYSCIIISPIPLNSY